MVRTKVSNETLDLDFECLTAKDIRNHPITKSELKNTVSLYYDLQDYRISAGNRTYATEHNENEAPDNMPFVLKYIEERCKVTEKNIAKFLENYAESNPIGRWLLSIPGIGGVLACALMSYIDINKCQTAGAIWNYAGWAGPSEKRKKGEKLNYNPKFRVVCWKIGQQFIKLQNNDKDIYGHLYAQKKQFYIEKNEAGGFAERAAELIKGCKNKTTEAYKAYSEGKLPKAQINAMASRFAVKIFLSHLFEVWYEYEFKKPAPKPFVEQHLGHVHIIKAPNRDILFSRENN